MGMNKTERDEIRRIIRARFKVLRSDVDQRKAELLAELEAGIAARFADEDKRWMDICTLVSEAVQEANRKVNDLYREFFGDEWGVNADRGVVAAQLVPKPNRTRVALRIRGEREIDVKVKAALLELERREVDLLAELATSALETAEARSFMQRIPTVSELVPASRLKEIEGAL